MKFFKPEDFEIIIGWTNIEACKDVALIANAKLEREGKVVFGANKWWRELELTNQEPSHKALLINIEAIEKCSHPIEKIRANDPNVIHGFVCLCGAKVKPREFEEI